MKKGYLYIFLSTIFFSSMEIALKIVASDYNPMQINFLRFLIGSIILLPLAIRQLHQRNAHWQFQNIIFFAISGFLCVVVSMTFFQMAILYSKASIVAILFSCNAVFVIPLAYFFLKEKLTWIHIVSMIVSVFGMLCIVNPKNLHNMTGIALTLLAAITFALYGIYGRRGCIKFNYNGVVLSCFSFLFGSVELLILMWLSHLPTLSSWLGHAGFAKFADMPILAGLSWHDLPSLIYLGVFVTGLGYSFYSMAMEELSAALASLVFYIKPALAPILALLILQETMTENVVIGIVFIVLGSMITFVGGSPALRERLHNLLVTSNHVHQSELAHRDK